MSSIDIKNGDVLLVSLLAAGVNRRDAAKQVGISEGTVYRRLRTPEFRERLDEARSSMLDEALGLLTRASTAAALKLEALLDATSEQVALGAARAILELGTRMREVEGIEERLEALEAVRMQPPSTIIHKIGWN
jgi:hypothetical protein